jgi:hypothetical protein
MFFFEKKNQKTFVHLDLVWSSRFTKGIKSFLLIFFKKEVLSYFPHVTAARSR